MSEFNDLNGLNVRSGCLSFLLFVIKISKISDIAAVTKCHQVKSLNALFQKGGEVSRLRPGPLKAF